MHYHREIRDRESHLGKWLWGFGEVAKRKLGCGAVIHKKQPRHHELNQGLAN